MQITENFKLVLLDGILNYRKLENVFHNSEFVEMKLVGWTLFNDMILGEAFKFNIKS
jgi:hypothetical protein